MQSPKRSRSCDKFRQGHLIGKPALFYWANLNYPLWAWARQAAEDSTEADPSDPLVIAEEDQFPEYGLITTQSCDLMRPQQQPWFQVAPVFRCEDDDDILDAEFILPLAPPNLEGSTWYVDLRLEMPLEKGVLVGREPIESYSSEEEYIRLADILARRKGRPALHSVFNRVLNEVMKDMKRESRGQGNLLRGIRPEVYKLKLSIQEGGRLDPAAAKLYIVTRGDPSADARTWFDEWWNRAREVAGEVGLELLPNGWLNAQSLDATFYDQLIEVSSRQIDPDSE
jgi:hypothetical protein